MTSRSPRRRHGGAIADTANSMTFQSILLVDDNEADAFLSRRIIEQSTNCRAVNIVRNGREALDFLAAVNPRTLDDAPDLILLDVNMPLINGWEFLEQFARFPDPIRKHSAVAILSGSEPPVEYRKARKRHAVADYCLKPLSRKSVQYLLSSLADRDPKDQTASPAV